MNIDFTLLIPEFVLAGVGLLVLAVDMVLPRDHARRNIALAGVAAAGLLAALLWGIFDLRSANEAVHNGIYFVDRFALVFKVILIGSGIGVIGMSVDYVGSRMEHQGEYYALIVFSVLGAVMMAAAGELLTAYIALELLSFSLYALVALARRDARSPEASTKYILLGAISSAVLLYGIGIIYGATGTTVFREMSETLPTLLSPTVVVGVVMLLGGIAFKLAVVPFHLWTPDVYEGAPTPITAHLSVLSKAAMVALALRFFAEGLVFTFNSWQLALAILAAVTMVVGTLVALVQTNVKRLLAYSSIAQVGFVMVGLAAIVDVPAEAGNTAAANAVVLHVAGYAFTNLAAFMVVMLVEMHTGREDMDGYNGLASRAPLLGMAMTASVFSLAGLPIFAGFVTKFYLFTAAADAEMLWLVIVATLASLVSLYYYLQIVRRMYIGKPEGGALLISNLGRGTLLILFAGTVAVGVFPVPFLDAIEAGVSVLRPFFATAG